MSEENVEIVRSALKRYADGDFSPIGLLSHDVELVSSPDVPDAGSYRGEEARRWLRARVIAFEGMTIEIEANEILGTGDKVFLEMRVPPGGAAELEGRWWLVSTFRGREIVRVEAFREVAQALEAAGLSE